MRRSLAIGYAKEIHRRLVEVGGRIPTPRGDREYVKIKRVWVFGSTAKGKANPNDLDIMILKERGGARQSWEAAGFDPEVYRTRGVKTPRSSESESMKWLTAGMRNVSRHDRIGDEVQIDVQYEIYPQYELPDNLPVVEAFPDAPAARAKLPAVVFVDALRITGIPVPEEEETTQWFGGHGFADGKPFVYPINRTYAWMTPQIKRKILRTFRTEVQEKSPPFLKVLDLSGVQHSDWRHPESAQNRFFDAQAKFFESWHKR